jgi:hypothetical protein
MIALGDTVADAGGAGFAAGGDTVVCAVTELDRTAVSNAVFRQGQVRNMDISFLGIGISECAWRSGRK